MSPTVRSQTRGPTLATTLSHGRLRAAWKNTVRPGLRNQVIGDLHDHMDVHRRIASIAARLHAEVLAGSYRVREPEFVSWEKSLGITRRVVVPSPEDAILLQAVIDGMERPLLSSQPSANAYYARSHAPPSIEHVDSSFPYPWWELWPEFQERIWSFGRGCPLVVMTDVANYFDAIPLNTLRNRLVSLAHLREELVDFLFFLLEGLAWRPDYIPASGVGLPQIQFDAPRLLAHAYLFEADAFLERQSTRAFVRWMDDINVGVGSFQEGKKLLKDLDEMIAAMGLRLNAGKTKILSGREALAELWMTENRRINRLDHFITSGGSQSRASSYARGRFATVWRGTKRGAWPKIIRRYLSVFTRLKDAYLDRHVLTMLNDVPSLRDKVFDYLKVLGYSPGRFKALQSFLLSGHCVDDMSLYGGLEVLWSWSIPQRSGFRRQASQLAVSVWSKRRDNHIAVACVAAVLAKFASSQATTRFMVHTSRVWRQSEWAARQMAALLPAFKASDARKIAGLIAAYGLRDAMEVLIHLRDLSRRTSLDAQLRSYLLHPRGRYPYPFQKVLIALALFRGALQTTDRTAILAHVRHDAGDPRFVEMLEAV